MHDVKMSNYIEFCSLLDLLVYLENAVNTQLKHMVGHLSILPTWN